MKYLRWGVKAGALFALGRCFFFEISLFALGRWGVMSVFYFICF
jgi:hypothetical protein